MIGTIARALAISVLASGASAQVVTDGSVGRVVNLRGGAFAITDEIGVRKGANLFHSFTSFDVGRGQVAIFGVPAGVTSVIGRVTGASASTIDGLVSFADPSFSAPIAADFWFFNPNGVMIGPDAQFRTSGALFISGGDSVNFADGNVLSADRTAPLNLTAAEPEAFGFLSAAPGPVAIRGARLPAQGDGIFLSGGEVLIDGASLFSEKGGDLVVYAGAQGDVAPGSAGGARPGGGTIRIVGRNGSIGGRPAGSVVSDSGGAVSLKAGEIVITGGAVLARALVSDGGDVAIDAGQLRVSNGGAVGTLAPGGFDAGAVAVSARDILLITGGAIRSQTQGGGDAGAIEVTGFGTLRITRAGQFAETTIESEVSTGAAGNAGGVRVEGGELILEDAGRIFSTTFGAGDSGDIVVRVDRIFGDAGAQIGSGALDVPFLPGRSTGAAGAISVTARESMAFNGVRRDSPLAEPEASGIFSSSEGTRTGRGGDVFASAPLIRLTNEAEIGAETFNPSPAGRVVLRGGSLFVDRGAEVSTTSRTSGAAGDVRLSFSDAVAIGPGGGAASRALGDGGTAGRVIVSAGAIQIRDGQITTASRSADGGSILLSASGFTEVNGGTVTTSVGADAGDGGAIMVRGGPLVLRNGARLESTAQQGDGGAVTIASSLTFIEPGSVIDVSSALGQDGEVRILGVIGAQSTETEPPPAEFFDQFALIDDFCVAAVTGGSALRLLAPRAPAFGAAATPGLFGAAIPYPAAGAAAAAPAGSLVLASGPSSCADGG